MSEIQTIFDFGCLTYASPIMLKTKRPKSERRNFWASLDHFMKTKNLFMTRECQNDLAQQRGEVAGFFCNFSDQNYATLAPKTERYECPNFGAFSIWNVPILKVYCSMNCRHWITVPIPNSLVFTPCLVLYNVRNADTFCLDFRHLLCLKTDKFESVFQTFPVAGFWTHLKTRQN